MHCSESLQWPNDCGMSAGLGGHTTKIMRRPSRIKHTSSHPQRYIIIISPVPEDNCHNTPGYAILDKHQDELHSPGEDVNKVHFKCRDTTAGHSISCCHRTLTKSDR